MTLDNLLALASKATSGVLNDVGDLSRAQVIDHKNYFRGNVTVWWWWWVAYEILVSAPVPFWDYLGWNWVGLGWDKVWGDWGLRGWGLGLDNC